MISAPPTTSTPHTSDVAPERALGIFMGALGALRAGGVAIRTARRTRRPHEEQAGRAASEPGDDTAGGGIFARSSLSTLDAIETLRNLVHHACRQTAGHRGIVQAALQEWAGEPLTATLADQTPPAGHPAYGLSRQLAGIMGGRLHFAATETAPDMGGLMEGAMASAERVATAILEDAALGYKARATRDPTGFSP